ncbi:hypothetical protein V1524DRAFT_427543 [Lipomyces starkeyi]
MQNTTWSTTTRPSSWTAGSRCSRGTLAMDRVCFALCETAMDKTAGRNGKWDVADGVGEASAVTIERETGQVVIYCFNCSVLSVVLQCGEQYGFGAEGDEVVELGEARKINWHCRQDISFDGDYRLFLLDAPMGTGKTHAVREYLRTNPMLKAISISFRQYFMDAQDGFTLP